MVLSAETRRRLDLDIREVVVIVWMVVIKMAAINISIDFHGTPKLFQLPALFKRYKKSGEGGEARGY